MELLGRAALITGGSRGIGRAITLSLARAGADVAINYLSDDKAAGEVLQMCQMMGRKVVTVKGDISDPHEATEVVRSAVVGLGKLDVLVNNAGVAWARGQFIEEADLDLAKRVMDVNFWGAFYATHFALPFIRRQPVGHIFFVSSSSTRHFSGGLGPYAAAKAAIEGLARCLAHELQPSSPFHGDCAMKEDCPHRPATVRVNVLAPWVTDTEMGNPPPSDTAGDSVQMRFARPFGRLISPDEIGDLCVYLASAKGSYLSGQTIYIDGGRF